MRENPRHASSPATRRALRVVAVSTVVGVIGLTTWYVAGSSAEQVRREGDRLLVDRDAQLDHLGERIEAKIEEDDADAAQARECLVQALVAVQRALVGDEAPAVIPPACAEFIPPDP